MKSKVNGYLSSIGVAMKLANITVGAWQRDPSDAIATPHNNTVTPITNAKITQLLYRSQTQKCSMDNSSSKAKHFHLRKQKVAWERTTNWKYSHGNAQCRRESKLLWLSTSKENWKREPNQSKVYFITTSALWQHKIWLKIESLEATWLNKTVRFGL